MTEENEAPVPVYFRAKLDADCVYWGVEEVSVLTDGDIEVPADCDLKPGHYKYNRQANWFEALPREQKRDTPEVPSFERALFALIKSLPYEPPLHCKEWAAWYEKSFDTLGRKA